MDEWTGEGGTDEEKVIAYTTQVNTDSNQIYTNQMDVVLEIQYLYRQGRLIFKFIFSAFVAKTFQGVMRKDCSIFYLRSEKKISF